MTKELRLIRDVQKLDEAVYNGWLMNSRDSIAHIVLKKYKLATLGLSHSRIQEIDGVIKHDEAMEKLGIMKKKLTKLKRELKDISWIK